MYRRPACNDAVPCGASPFSSRLVLAGCGGDDETPTGDLDAGEFLQRITAEHLSGDFNDTWEDLHPAHQKLISQIQFVYCGEREPELEDDTTVRILSVEPVTQGAPSASRSARCRPCASSSATRTASSTRTPRTPSASAATWRWVLSAAFVRAVESGNCPDGSPLP